jgi:hypothetical protein
LPQAVLVGGGGARLDRVVAEERERQQLDRQPALSHIVLDQGREHVAAVLGAEGALHIDKLDHPQRSIGGSENRPTLRDPLEQ